jgi:hypothetical protein
MISVLHSTSCYVAKIYKTGIFFLLITDLYFRTQQKVDEAMEIKKETDGSRNKILKSSYLVSIHPSGFHFRSCLPTRLPAYLPTYVRTYLPTYLPK